MTKLGEELEYSIMSLDFVKSSGRWYLIEQNSQPGLPPRFMSEEVADAVDRAIVEMSKKAIRQWRNAAKS
jgi:hypothetical protein